MKKYENFWQVGEFNVQGKNRVPVKLVKNGFYKVLFPHYLFQHDLSQHFEKKIKIRNESGEMFEIFFNKEGRLIKDLDPKEFKGFKYLDGKEIKEYSDDVFKDKWGSQTYYNIVYATSKYCEKDPVTFETKDKIHKYLKSNNCHYCGVKTIPTVGLINSNTLEEFNIVFDTELETVEEMKNHINKEKKRAPSKVAEFDHKFEKTLGGNNHPDNMILLCHECHKSKSGALKYVTGTPEQYGFFINNNFKEKAPEITHNMMLKKFEKDYDPKILELKINQC